MNRFHHISLPNTPLKEIIARSPDSYTYKTSLRHKGIPVKMSAPGGFTPSMGTQLQQGKDLNKNIADTPGLAASRADLNASRPSQPGGQAAGGGSYADGKPTAKGPIATDTGPQETAGPGSDDKLTGGYTGGVDDITGGKTGGISDLTGGKTGGFSDLTQG